MGKYFFKPDERTGDTIKIIGNSAHHLLHVLRLRIGHEVVFCNGQNIDYCAKLVSASEKPASLTFNILSESPSNTEAVTPITLYQGLPKGDKIDWIVEKCTEAGISKIIQVYTARTVVKVKDSAKKTERLARISESAAAQSMRGTIPAVLPPISFAKALEDIDDSNLHLIAFEREQTRSIKSVISNLKPSPIALWVGPEGGFEECEAQALEKKGAIPISLGPRILRTETAGLVALTQILCIWD